MFNLFKKRSTFSDEGKNQFVEAIASMLEVQLVPIGRHSIEFSNGGINPKALGYVYGFIDAALRTIGQDMSDSSVGISVTFQVLRHVFPGREEKYMQYLADHVGTDNALTLGVLTGGQQYLDFNAGKLAAPMGLARYILAAE